MAKDPHLEEQRRAREAQELRIKTEREQKKADEAIKYLRENVDIDEYEATKNAAEKAVERGPLKKKTPMEILEEKGRKAGGFKRRGRDRDKDRDFER